MQWITFIYNGLVWSLISGRFFSPHISWNCVITDLSDRYLKTNNIIRNPCAYVTRPSSKEPYSYISQRSIHSFSCVRNIWRTTCQMIECYPRSLIDRINCIEFQVFPLHRNCLHLRERERVQLVSQLFGLPAVRLPHGHRRYDHFVMAPHLTSCVQPLVLVFNP